MGRRLIVLLSLIVAAAVLADPGLTLRASQADDAASGVLRLRATDLQGREWTAADLRGRVVLIDFWATWCAPCLAELPRLEELRNGYTRDEFEILGVMLEPSDRRTIVSWLNRHRIDWPQIHERAGYQGRLAASFGVRRLPATVLIDATGRVAAIDLRGDALRRRVDELVGAVRASDRPVARKAR